MRLGIIGLPLAGKTTVFNALTGASISTGLQLGPGKVEVHSLVADIPDRRLDALSDLFRPRKITHAQVTFVDVDGLRVETEGHGLPGALASHLATADGLLGVVRAFPDESVPHPLGEVDAARDLRLLENELLLHDMLAVERRLERLAEERQKGGRDRAALERERAIFERLQAHLAEERPLRGVELPAEEESVLAGFLLLSRKPMLVLANISEEAAAASDTLDLPSAEAGLPRLAFAGKLEMEIAQLPAVESQAFLEGYGLREPGRLRVLRACYELLGLQSFFTANEQEAKAWTLRRGSTALQAAEAIHSEIAQGFVRAEVIAWDELIQTGGLPQARARGLLRVEGKEYIVGDGEYVIIRASR
jgi:GTP-binding protein YchF